MLDLTGLKDKKPCCVSCKNGSKCDMKNTIQKPRPKINKKKMEEKYKYDPLYQMFGNQYLVLKKNNI